MVMLPGGGTNSDISHINDTNKLLIAALFSKAAYHQSSQELSIDQDHDTAANIEAYSALISAGWVPLNSAGNGLSNFTPSSSSLDDGIYYHENAAAFLAVNDKDQMVISFRGTNGGIKDVVHWFGSGRGAHYELLKEFVENAIIYAGLTGIDEILVTGHSLGASMVEAVLGEYQLNHALLNPPNPLTINPMSLEGIGFASPGYDWDFPFLGGGRCQVINIL